MLDAGGYCLHIWEMGCGSPAVIFDAALGASCLSWLLVQPEVARFARAVTYDRAGLGWSDLGPEPRTARHIAEELHTLLQTANLPPPYVLVGHSFGGFSAQLFASRFREEVAGLVLVDVPSPSEWVSPSPQDLRRLEIGARLARRGAWAARLGIARVVSWLVSSGARGMARMAVSLVDGGILRPADQDRILAPLHCVPKEYHPALKHLWTQPKFFSALASQMENLPETAKQVLEAGVPPDLPLVVLTAASPSPSRLHEQVETARLSRRGRNMVASHSGHWIPLEEPELVIQAIREVIAESCRQAW